MIKRRTILLSWSLAIFLLSILGCTNPKKEFDKYSFIKECGISLDGMMLPTSVADSLITVIQNKQIIDEGFSYPEISKDLSNAFDIYLRDRDIRACYSVCLELSNETYSDIEESLEDTLRNHFLAIGFELSNDANELLGIVLSYAKKAPYNLRRKIGETSFSLAKSINDTLTARCVFRIVEALSEDDINSISKDNARRIVYWSLNGLPYEEAALGTRSLFSSLINASYIAGYKSADSYADSLFSMIKRMSIEPDTRQDDDYFLSGGPIRRRYYSALKQHDYKTANEILDYYLDGYVYHSKVDSVSLYNELGQLDQYIKNRSNPRDSLGDFTVEFYNIFTGLSENYKIENNREKYFLTFTGCLEKSRILYIQNNPSYSDWLTRVFYLGIDKTFPSMAAWQDFFDLLSPSYLYIPEIIHFMTYQYNNTDPKAVYDACLFIKGASDRIPIEIYKRIKESNNTRIIQFADSVRFDLPARAFFSSEEQRIMDSVEVSLKDILKSNMTKWQDIRSSLYDNEVAIEFIACPPLESSQQTTYKAIILCSDSTAPLIVDLCSELELRNAIILKENKAALYNLIWKPIDYYLKERDTIYYSTDGILNLCNVPVLNSNNKTLLMDKYQMHQVSSTREVINRDHLKSYLSISMYGGLDYIADFNSNAEKAEIPKTTGRIDRSICHGSFDYLPHSLEEVNAISKTADKFGIEHTNVVGNKGTEEYFYSTNTHPSDILHIATHGFYYSKTESSDVGFFDNKEQLTPLDRCGLVLSRGQHIWTGEPLPEGVEDGILLGSEIIRLDLEDVDLVVLSACNTALGDVSGEGIAGLRQAFKRAGVKSLLMTLSKVDDEATSFFMTNFYEHLFSGEDKHSAYYAAINTMRSSERFSDPKYWSPFILVD